MELNHLEKEVLLKRPNQNVERELQNAYVHLKNLQLNDRDSYNVIVVIHVIPGISEDTKIKTQERPRVTLPSKPVAELTKFGWVIVSSGQEGGITNMLLGKSKTKCLKYT